VRRWPARSGIAANPELHAQLMALIPAPIVE
jgi:hypothetical protein